MLVEYSCSASISMLVWFSTSINAQYYLTSNRRHKHTCAGLTYLLHNASLSLAEGRVSPQLVVNKLHLNFHPSSRFLARFSTGHPGGNPSVSRRQSRVRSRGSTDLHLTPLPLHPSPVHRGTLLVVPGVRVSVGAAQHSLHRRPVVVSARIGQVYCRVYRPQSPRCAAHL